MKSTIYDNLILTNKDQEFPAYYPEDYSYDESIFNDNEFYVSKIKWILDNKLPHNERALFLIFTENMSNYAKTSKQINCSIPTLRKYIGMIRQKIIDNI